MTQDIRELEIGNEFAAPIGKIRAVYPPFYIEGDGPTIINVQNYVNEHLHNRFPIKVKKSVASGAPLLTNGHLGADLIRLEPGQEFAAHTHPGDHLLFVLRGRGTITVDGIVYQTEPGDLYMVPGLQIHAVGASVQSTIPHVIMAIGSPHKRIDAEDRMELA